MNREELSRLIVQMGFNQKQASGIMKSLFERMTKV
jgi:hypothetical protein